MKKRVSGQVGMVFAVALLPSITLAQTGAPTPDVEKTTPPELRDFRLDPPPTPPGPEQTAPPPPERTTVQPPPAVPTTEPTSRTDPRPAPRREADPAPRAADRTVDAPPREGANPAPVDSNTPAAPVPATDTLPPTIPETVPAEPSAAPVDAPPALRGDNGLWAWIAAGAALVAALTGGLFLWRRRSVVTLPGQANSDPPLDQPSPPARLRTGADDRPAPRPDPVPAPVMATPALSIQFAPTTAQLSIASLTVTGRLTVENLASGEVGQLSLRSQMISAQDGQRDAIAAFHANPRDGEVQSLGNLTPGERIDAIVEIRLPRSELHAFRWTEREFVAPIVLINIAGQMGDTPVEARLSHLIGRGGADASARMKPLAIDRGPKRFSEVEARPVLA